MDYMKLVALALCSAVCAMTLHHIRPEASTVVIMAAGAMTILLALPSLADVVSSLLAMAQSGSVADKYLQQLLKVAGISLLMDFSAQSCRDAGAESLAMKVELAGRIMLLSLALPFMQALLGQVLSLSP